MSHGAFENQHYAIDPNKIIKPNKRTAKSYKTFITLPYFDEVTQVAKHEDWSTNVPETEVENVLYDLGDLSDAGVAELVQRYDTAWNDLSHDFIKAFGINLYLVYAPEPEDSYADASDELLWCVWPVLTKTKEAKAFEKKTKAKLQMVRWATYG
jgi:hypothetical protein